MVIDQTYTFKRKVLINLITGGMGLVNVIVASSFMKFYTDVIGMSAATFGIVFLVFSIWNGINDPVLGYWADKRPFVPGKGKYAPLIRWSIPVIGFTVLSILFASPDWEEMFTAIYLLVLLVIYEGFQTVLSISFHAFRVNTFLSMKERTEVQVIGSYIIMIPVFVGGMIPIWFLTGEFSRGAVVSVFSGAILFGLIFTWIGSLYVKEDEEFYKRMEISQGLKELFRLFLQLIKSKTFLIYVIAVFFINAATGNYFVGYLYYMDNVLLVSGLKATIPDILTGIMQMAIFPLIIMAVKKYGSRKTWSTGLLISVVAHAALTFQINYWVAAATFIVMLAGYAFNTALMQPMQGLVVDHIELRTGKRQPAVVGGIMAVFLIPAASIQPLILSSLLSASGYVGAVKEQTEAVVSAIRIGTGIVPAIMLLIGIVFLNLLPINHQREKEIHVAIQTKHKGNHFLNPEKKVHEHSEQASGKGVS